MIRTFAIAAVLALTLPAISPKPGHAANIEIEAQGPVIELRVTETVEVEPDLVTISAGVRTQAPTAVEALRRNSAEMTRVIERIKSLGVDAKEIQTSRIRVNARYDYNRELQKNEFQGYVANNSVTVTMRDLDRTGMAMDALVSAGATDLSGPNFRLEKDAEPKAKARKQAVANARAMAQDYADLFGYDGYRLLEIAESVRSSARQRRSRTGAVRAASIAESAAPVEPGLVDTGVTLTIKFELTEESAQE